MATKDTLDFCVIGAQKSGTTALFHYLYKNSEIYLPENKEAPFFNQCDEGAFTEYMATVFKAACPSQKLGTISPQYLCSDGIAARIVRLCPDIRLVALLRDPVERAISHYNMLVERGVVSIGPDDFFLSQLDADDLSRRRALPAVMGSEAETCLVWGEYGRLLQAYYDQFPSEQIFVATYGEFVERPGVVVKRILRHCGASENYTPNNLGKKYFESARDPFLFLKKGRLYGGLKWLWEMIPGGSKYWIRNSLGKVLSSNKASTKHKPSPPVVDKLIEYYRSDLVLLEKLTGVTFGVNTYE